MDSSCYSVEKSLNDHKAKVPQDVVNEVENAIREARESTTSGDLERMKTAKTNLDNASMKIGQAVYSQANTENQQQQQPEGEQQQQQQEGEQQQQQEEGEKEGENKEKKNN